jgi:hypothetical protein
MRTEEIDAGVVSGEAEYGHMAPESLQLAGDLCEPFHTPVPCRVGSGQDESNERVDASVREHVLCTKRPFFIGQKQLW